MGFQSLKLKLKLGRYPLMATMTLTAPLSPTTLSTEHARVMEQIYAPDPVPHKRLWEVCSSLARFDERLPYLGHDYGGLPTHLTPSEEYP